MNASRWMKVKSAGALFASGGAGYALIGVIAAASVGFFLLRAHYIDVGVDRERAAQRVQDTKAARVGDGWLGRIRDAAAALNLTIDTIQQEAQRDIDDIDYNQAIRDAEQRGRQAERNRQFSAGKAALDPGSCLLRPYDPDSGLFHSAKDQQGDVFRDSRGPD